ncbi:hypothetical protein K505DRAFT_321290 [Melanomma pulvis-pyrius CBS 109.77]|uniref:DUF676 domain-containing protein n=1 Tax=Melanomma pulvis-pyrius CBS 109.77 TaxID=1314802 RepID=A0A6A6XTY7_9PLEO|nr:hypothetical protein K505DRAFT_321290 [Melanomma pulvis-pyrius CBS 109.77]
MALQFFRRIDNMEEPSQDQMETLIQLERSDALYELQPQNEQFGLFRMDIPTQQATLQYEHNLDIIAVHGLGGDAYRTWHHENGFNWLQHIHEELPGIRVYSYGHDSGVAFSTGTAGLTDYARHLLSLVKLTRSSENVSWF